MAARKPRKPAPDANFVCSVCGGVGIFEIPDSNPSKRPWKIPCPHCFKAPKKGDAVAAEPSEDTTNSGNEDE